MKFEVRVKQLGDGGWQARYIGGRVESLALRDASRAQALERMKAEIRCYHLEWCPCSGVSDDFVELVEVEERASRPHSA